MIINSEELHLFKTLYETQSLSETAQRLNISLSKASRGLSSLRHTFEDRLFMRCDNRMCPTMRARELQPKILELIRGFSSLDQAGGFAVENIQRVFSIGGLDNALLSFIGPAIPALSERAPGVRLNFRTMSPNLYADLRQGNLDLAVYATRESFSGFSRLALCEDAYVYVARSTSLLARRAAAGEILSEREIRSRMRIQITLPKASADDCGLIPVIDQIQNPKNAPVLSAPYFVTVPLLLGEEDTTCIPFQTAHVLSKTAGLTVLGRPKGGMVYEPSFIWAQFVDHEPAHQWLRSFLYEEIRRHLADLGSVPVLNA